MKIIPTSLDGAVVIEPKVFGDERGFFLESFNAKRFAEAGLPTEFFQDNLSFSRRGVLRGLHFQNPNPQGKLVWVLQGSVYDVAVDLRRKSKTFGQWFGHELSSENRAQFYVPPGFGHGFIVTSETALFTYKCTELYSPQTEKSLLWNDPDLGITWPSGIEPQLSAKDLAGKRLRDFGADELF
jgi:dTDP-4-dehydrorhamnose 3,5-epimerase